MRESTQRARPFIPQVEPRSQMGAPAVRTAQPPSQIAVSGASHISALRDATVAEADTEEALAAAAALWGVLFQRLG